MRIEVLIIFFLVSLGMAFLNYKNKKESEKIRLKMKSKPNNLDKEPIIEHFFDKKTEKCYVTDSENSKEEVKIFHLIPCRFVKQMKSKLGPDTNDWLSIVLSKEEYKMFIGDWIKAIGKDGESIGWTGKTTSTATIKNIEEAARKIYKDYPEILKALGL